MLSTLRMLLSGTCLAAFVAPALAVTYLEKEEFGPALELDRNALGHQQALANLPGRVYLLQKHWSGPGFNKRTEGVAAYEGDAEASNRALAEFALLPDDLVTEIHLLPAPGVSRSLKRNVTQPCDFEVRWTLVESWSNQTKGVSARHQVTLTVYIERAAAVPPLDPRAPQWIKDLDSDHFIVRQTAFERLEQERDAARNSLQKALDAKDVTLEGRRRIEQLLKRLDPIHARRLRLPKKAAVFGPDELLQREAENWRSGDLRRSLSAANQISALAEFTEESFPLLIEMLHDGREQVRDLAVVAFVQLGSRASGAVPALKAARPTMTEQSGAALATAVAAAMAAPIAADTWRQNRRCRAEIGQLLRDLKKH
jgi:hypothetical protein